AGPAVSSAESHPSSARRSRLTRSGLPAEEDRAEYGELPKPVGPMGSVCHQVWRAEAIASANRAAGWPRSPIPAGPGSDVGWSSTPLARVLRFGAPGWVMGRFG